jgi:hypothetical protein
MADIVRFQTSSAEPYPLSVSGESNYKHNISDVTGYMDEDDGVDVDDLRAQLILEDDNSYDANAVCIKIDDKTVGYLSRFDAKRYRQRLSGMGLTDAIGECWASVRGGFIKKDGSFADFGVRLDIDLDNLQIENKDQVMVPTSTPKPVQPPSVFAWPCLWIGCRSSLKMLAGAPPAPRVPPPPNTSTSQQPLL